MEPKAEAEVEAGRPLRAGPYDRMLAKAASASTLFARQIIAGRLIPLARTRSTMAEETLFGGCQWSGTAPQQWSCVTCAMKYARARVRADKIVARKIPSRAVYETGAVYAFHDIAPTAPVHIIIVREGAVALCGPHGRGRQHACPV